MLVYAVICIPIFIYVIGGFCEEGMNDHITQYLLYRSEYTKDNDEIFGPAMIQARERAKLPYSKCDDKLISIWDLKQDK